jgi:hypothetical protein
MVKTYFVMYYDKCYKVCFHSNKHENFLRFETNVDSLEENISELVFLFYVFLIMDKIDSLYFLSSLVRGPFCSRILPATAE